MTENEILALIATIAAGVLRTSVGVGSGIALTASLSLLFNPHLTLAVMAYLQIGLGTSALLHYWKRWNADLVLRFVPWIFVGVVAGTWIINVVPVEWARRVLGLALALVAATELVRNERVLEIHLNRRLSMALAGMASGIAGSTANASGAVAGMYLKRFSMKHEVFLGTLSAVVIVHDVFRLAVFWNFQMLTTEAFTIALMLLPFAFLGGWIGSKVRTAGNERLLRRTVFGLVLLVGITLLR